MTLKLTIFFDGCLPTQMKHHCHFSTQDRLIVNPVSGSFDLSKLTEDY